MIVGVKKANITGGIIGIAPLTHAVRLTTRTV